MFFATLAIFSMGVCENALNKESMSTHVTRTSCVQTSRTPPSNLATRWQNLDQLVFYLKSTYLYFFIYLQLPTKVPKIPLQTTYTELMSMTEHRFSLMDWQLLPCPPLRAAVAAPQPAKASGPPRLRSSGSSPEFAVSVKHRTSRAWKCILLAREVRIK